MTTNFIETYGLEEYVDNDSDFKQIPELFDRTFGIEDVAINQLGAHIRANFSDYFPKIDLSFMSMTHPKTGIAIIQNNDIESSAYRSTKDQKRIDNANEYLIGFPRFASYKLNDPRNKAQITFGIDDKKFDGFYAFSSRVEGNEGEIKWQFVDEKPDDVRLGIEANYNESEWLRIRLDLESNFNGILPTKIRNKILELTPIITPYYRSNNQIISSPYGQNSRNKDSGLRIIAEVETWNLDVSPIYIGDPLLVANVRDEYYLIDQFDTTPIEDYVSREFTI